MIDRKWMTWLPVLAVVVFVSAPLSPAAGLKVPPVDETA